jgi:hypothetical protein
MAAPDQVAEDGRGYTPRGDVLARLPGTALARDRRGEPVHGNFLWSAQDSLEWVHGFGTLTSSPGVGGRRTRGAMIPPRE